MVQPFKHILTSENEIRDIIGNPSEVVNRKEINFIDEHCKQFIALSPLLFISTSDKHGACDVSPRGDAPGSVLVLDDKHLVIPERPGNRRIDSMRNILTNPNIGLIFLIPGLEETLRINGEAYIISDEDILEKMKVANKSPLLGIAVKVNECYIHCAKAFKRSKLWEPQAWHNENKLPYIPKVIADHVNSSDFTVEVINERLQDSYKKRLY